MQRDLDAALAAAKGIRDKRTTALEIAGRSVAALTSTVTEWQKGIATLEHERGTQVAAACIDDVVSIDALLLKAKVALEIELSRAAAAKHEHAVAASAHRKAVADVKQAGIAVLYDEMIWRSREIQSMLDRVIDSGEILKSLAACDGLNIRISDSLPRVPPGVLAVIERIPQKNPLDMPISFMRGGVQSDAWSQRLQALIA